MESVKISGFVEKTPHQCLFIEEFTDITLDEK